MPIFPHQNGHGHSDSNGTAIRQDRLAALPDDILIQIAEELARNSKKDLCSFALLNSHYHKISDAVLYKSILFKTPELHLIFSDSLSRRPRRGSTILEIKLAYPSSQLSQLPLDGPVHNSHYRPSSFDTLSRTLSVMSNLERLDIAVPDALLHGIGSLFNGPFDLTCLKWCSLYYQTADNSYWDLRENIHIFAHPSVETLIVKRARLDDQGFNFLERPHQTSLKKLHLLDCDINDDGLSDLLEFPEALEEFVMTQPEDPSPPLEETTDHCGDYVMALKSQVASLKTLVIDSPTLGCRRPLRMREFQALTTMRLNWDYQLFGSSSKKPRLHSAGLPPQLEVLEFFNELGTDDEVTDLLANLIEMKDVVARNWKTFIVSEEEAYVPKVVKNACNEHGLDLVIIGADETDDDD